MKLWKVGFYIAPRHNVGGEQYVITKTQGFVASYDTNKGSTYVIEEEAWILNRSLLLKLNK